MHADVDMEVAAVAGEDEATTTGEWHDGYISYMLLYISVLDKS